jgi:hypothetical protein
MTQAHPVPDMHACGSLAVENVASFAGSLIGSDERDNQVQLRAGIDNPANATKNSIHFAKRSESIDVNRLQAGGLCQQFFVGHDDDTPRYTNQNSRIAFAQLPSSVYSTKKLLIGLVSMTARPSINISFVPPHECAEATVPAKRPVASANIKGA